MSADNGVYVLVSRGPKTGHGRHAHRKTEYRVIHAHAIENIYAQDYSTGDPEPTLNRQMVLKFFGEARVFTNRELATAYAQGLHDGWESRVGYVEYGIVIIDEFADLPFPQPSQVKESQLTAVS